MSLRTAKGAGLRVFIVIDEFTRICVGDHVGYSIGATEVRHVLERIFEDHGRPQMIRSDNGREFIAASLLNWLKDDQGVAPVQVAKASPPQNGFLAPFNGPMRHELLNPEVFLSLSAARVVIGQWVTPEN